MNKVRQRLFDVKGSVRQLFVGAAILLLLLFSGYIVTAQDQETLNMEQEVVPDSLFLEEGAFRVTLTLTGDSSSCPIETVARPLDIVLVLDRSGSMNHPSGIDTLSRMDVLKEAVGTFLNQLDFTRDRVGIVEFDNAANVVHPLDNDLVSISGALEEISASGGTSIDAGVEIARRELKDRGRDETGLIMVLFTDGITRDNEAALDRARDARDNNGIRLITVGLGGRAVDQELLRGMASRPADFHLVEEASDLEEVYITIAEDVIQATAAATDIVVEHRFDATAFEVAPDSISPDTGSVSGNSIRWPIREIMDASLTLSYELRPLSPGSYRISQGDTIQYNACGSEPRALNLPPAMPVSVQQLPTPTPTSTPTPTITPTPSPTPIPPSPPTPTPTFEERSTQYINQLRCDPSWLLYLLLLLLLLFFIWWLRKLWQEYQKPEHERAVCRLIPWLFVPLTLILLWFFLSRLDLCGAESVYFWRIDPGSSRGEIYVTDKEGFRPVAGFEAINQNYSCVGCHAVTSTGQKIAAITESGAGPVVVYTLAGEAVDVPAVTGSYVDWSPDGNRLAISTPQGNIVILDMTTGQITPLAGTDEPGITAMMPSWSPDGRQIAFARGASSPNPFTLAREADIYVVPAAGGAAVPLAGASGDGMNYYPAYSPDGNWLAFTRHTDGSTTYAAPQAEIFIVPAAGGERIRLPANDDLVNGARLENVSNSWPTWSADGQWLAFNSKRYDPSYDLFLTRIDATGQSGEAVPLAGASVPGVFEHLPFWGAPPQVNPWAVLLSLWPFLLLYLLLWLLYWLCRRLRQPAVRVVGLPEPPVPPEELPPVSLDPIWQVAPTLIIGVGGTGRWTLTHLKKTLLDGGHGSLPEKVSFVLLDTSETEETKVYRDHRGEISGVQFAGVSLTPDEMLLMGQNLSETIGRTKDAALAGWFAHDEYQALPESAKNLANGTRGRRQLARAGLISKLRQGAEAVSTDKSSHLVSNDALRLWQFLVDGSRETLDGKQVRIILVGSLAGGMSGTLLDLAHLARLAGESVLPSGDDGAVHLEGFFTTDGVFKDFVSNPTQLQINAVSTARELQRFQLAASFPFMMDYRSNQDNPLPEDQSYLNKAYRKKLFDDIILLGGEGSPERGEGKSGDPWATTFATMADVIAFHMDASTQTGGRGDYREGVRRDMETRQAESQQAVVSAAGSFTYRLPLTDILHIVQTAWAQKLFHLFLNGDLQEQHVSFDPNEADLSEPPAEFARKFIMGEFEQAPKGMRVAGRLSVSAKLFARDVLQLVNTESGHSAFDQYLRRAMGFILNGQGDTGQLKRRAPRLGYAHAFIREVDQALLRAAEKAQNNQSYAPDNQKERSAWQRFVVWLGFGHTSQAEWQRVVDILEEWRNISAQSLASMAGIRQLLVGHAEEAETVIPGLYRELELRRAEAAQRPAQMNQVAVRRYLWSTPVDPDEDPGDVNNQRNLVDQWYEEAAQRLADYLQRFHWVVQADGSIQLSLITFKGRESVALDERRPETVRFLADALIELASHVTQDWAKDVSLADVLVTQFSGEGEQAMIPVIKQNWQVALPHLSGPSEGNRRDYTVAAAVGIPKEVQDDSRLQNLPPIFRDLRQKIEGYLEPTDVNVLTITDRTTLPIIREYNRIPILRLPEMEAAWRSYVRNAGATRDRLIEPITQTPVFLAERTALRYERRLEDSRVLNQPYRFLHPFVVLGLQRPRLAELYFLAVAAGWVQASDKRPLLAIPGLESISLQYPERGDLPPLLGGFFRVTANYKHDNDLRRALQDALANPTETTRQAWRNYIERFLERPLTPPPYLCHSCNAPIKPGNRFCTQCGADAPPPPPPPESVAKPYTGEPQPVQDLAALAALAAYRQLVTAEEWDDIIMQRSRLVL